MSVDISRTSSQETRESAINAKQQITWRETAAPQFMLPVKTALHQAVTDGRIHQARLLSASATNIDVKVNSRSKDVFVVILFKY